MHDAYFVKLTLELTASRYNGRLVCVSSLLPDFWLHRFSLLRHLYVSTSLFLSSTEVNSLAASLLLYLYFAAWPYWSLWLAFSTLFLELLLLAERCSIFWLPVCIRCFLCFMRRHLYLCRTVFPNFPSVTCVSCLCPWSCVALEQMFCPFLHPSHVFVSSVCDTSVRSTYVRPTVLGTRYLVHSGVSFGIRSFGDLMITFQSRTRPREQNKHNMSIHS